MSSDMLKIPSVQMPEAKIPRHTQAANEAELKKAAKEFESLFMNLVMQRMRETVPDSEMWGESSQKIKLFESMLDEEYSKLSADKSSRGLADIIYKQLSKRLAATEGASNEN